jgi:hypothetical protein
MKCSKDIKRAKLRLDRDMARRKTRGLGNKEKIKKSTKKQ